MIVEITIVAASLIVGGIGSYFMFGKSATTNNASTSDHNVANNSGSVNNVLINNESVSVEYYELLLAIYIICALKIIEFVFFLFIYTVIMKRIEKN